MTTDLMLRGFESRTIRQPPPAPCTTGVCGTREHHHKRRAPAGFPLLSPAGRFAVGLEREAILLARIRVNVRRSNGAARARIRKRLLSRCNGKPICALCGQPIDTSLRTPHPGSMEIDEKLPVSKGGDPFDLDNCQLTHRRCNQRKGNHQYTRLDTQPAPAAQRRAPQPIPLSRQW